MSLAKPFKREKLVGGVMSRMHAVSVSCLVALLLAMNAFAGMEMPAELKAEVSQYPDSTVVQIVSMGGNQVVMLDCGSADMREVYDFFSGKAKGNGWNVVMENQQADLLMMRGMKDNKQLTVNVTVEDGKTMTALSLAANQ